MGLAVTVARTDECILSPPICFVVVLAVAAADLVIIVHELHFIVVFNIYAIKMCAHQRLSTYLADCLVPRNPGMAIGRRWVVR